MDGIAQIGVSSLPRIPDARLAQGKHLSQLSSAIEAIAGGKIGAGGSLAAPRPVRCVVASIESVGLYTAKVYYANAKPIPYPVRDLTADDMGTLSSSAAVWLINRADISAGTNLLAVDDDVWGYPVAHDTKGEAVALECISAPTSSRNLRYVQVRDDGSGDVGGDGVAPTIVYDIWAHDADPDTDAPLAEGVTVPYRPIDAEITPAEDDSFAWAAVKPDGTFELIAVAEKYVTDSCSTSPAFGI